MNRSSKYRCQGVTLVEILIVMGMLVMLLGFAVPSFTDISVQAKMRAANENLQFALNTARKAARVKESAVRMSVVELPGERGHRISFSFVEPKGRGLYELDIQDFEIDKKIDIVSTFPSYEFDKRGVVKAPGRIKLISMVDKSFTNRVIIE
jgi:Tfp pilus assembly protein FimT